MSGGAVSAFYYTCLLEHVEEYMKLNVILGVVFVTSSLAVTYCGNKLVIDHLNEKTKDNKSIELSIMKKELKELQKERKKRDKELQKIVENHGLETNVKYVKANTNVRRIKY